MIRSRDVESGPAVRTGRGATKGPRNRKAPSVLHQEPGAVTWAREKAGLTKRALAGMVGLSEQYLGEFESGWRNASPTNLKKIADALNCPVAILERKRFHHSETALGNIDSLGNAIGAPGEYTIAGRLDTMEQRIGTIEVRLGRIERVLFALARAQGIDPETAG